MPDLSSALQQFHFLRPLWLLGLLLLPTIYVLTRQLQQHRSSWSQVIDSQLLNYLLEDRTTKTQRWPIYLLLISLVLTFIALAGPTWKQIPQPVHKAEDALVIVLDLSLSMEATDVKPSRLTKAKHKLIDILNQRQQGQTALVVYAGASHTVAPLTDDTDTIKALVPALSPVIMPALGNRVDKGIQLASQLIKDGGNAQGRILLITDGMETKHIKRITQALSRNTLSILAIGTEDGGPIPMPNQGFLKEKGEIVITKLALEPLQTLTKETGARLTKAQLSDADINYLLEPNTLGLLQSSRQVERQFDQWHEAGPWLLLLILPIAALAFRRGWLLSLLFLVLIQPPPAYAFGWKDLWHTRDQQGEDAFSQGNHKQAAELFESPAWKGSAAYKANDFEAAAEEYAKLDTPTAHYNRGNALAKAGKLDDALKAYEEALQQNPNFDDAKKNKQLIEQFKQQNQQQDQQGDDQSDKNQDNQNKNDQSHKDQQGSQEDPSSKDSNQQSQEQQNSSEKQNQQAQKQHENNAKEDEKNLDKSKQANLPPSDAQAKGQEKQKEVKDSPETELAQAENTPKLTEEQQQAMEQWLRRIPDDPSGLLKRKFDYQFRQKQQNNQFLPEKEDETLW